MEIYNYLGKKYYIFKEDIDQNMLTNVIKDLHKEYNLSNYPGWLNEYGNFASHILYKEIRQRYEKYGYLIFELEQNNIGRYNLYQNDYNFSYVYKEYQESKLKKTEITINKIEELIDNYERSIL